MKILSDLKGLGYLIALEGENIRLRYLGVDRQPSEAASLIEELRARKPEVLEFLKAQRPLPYFDLDGSLVIPFMADPRFHYWNGGQSIEDTGQEVKAWLH